MECFASGLYTKFSKIFCALKAPIEIATRRPKNNKKMLYKFYSNYQKNVVHQNSHEWCSHECR